MIVDPVCGMHIDPEKAPAFSKYGEHTYYFCSDTCKQQFDADPEKYIANAQAMNPEGYGTPQPTARR